MTITVNPCPFCGHDDVCIDEIAPGIAAVCCDECQTIGPHQDGAQTAEEAIAKWNKAADTLNQIKRHDAIMTEHVLRLEKQIDELRKAHA